jgi:farnesyl diphosphate synthase
MASKRSADDADGVSDKKVKTSNGDSGPSFDAVFKTALDKFLAYAQQHFELSAEYVERLNFLFTYNCIGGKCYRGALVTSCVETLAAANHTTLSADLLTKAHILGVCVEVLQACFLVADDLMDGSLTRRGQSCWYLVPTVKMDSVNDTLILESFIYFLLKEYFGDNSELFLQLSQLYHTVSLETQVGQMLDLLSQPQGRKGPEVLAKFNEDLYRKIVKYKTACYTFYLPLASGMILSGFSEEKDLAKARAICMELGEKFQIEDDYLDCYQDPEILGKIGTDIQDHKCSWLCVQALKRMNQAQRERFEANYGKDDQACIANIKELYRELKLEEVYFMQEEESLKKIQAMISTTDLPDLFTSILTKIHNRQR